MSDLSTPKEANRGLRPEFHNESGRTRLWGRVLAFTAFTTTSTFSALAFGSSAGHGWIVLFALTVIWTVIFANHWGKLD